MYNIEHDLNILMIFGIKDKRVILIHIVGYCYKYSCAAYDCFCAAESHISAKKPKLHSACTAYDHRKIPCRKNALNQDKMYCWYQGLSTATAQYNTCYFMVIEI